jgi:hypothetical protein
VTIDRPADGATTDARSILVIGRAPGHPRGGETDVAVIVNRRRVHAEVRGDRYGVRRFDIVHDTLRPER